MSPSSNPTNLRATLKDLNAQSSAAATAGAGRYVPLAPTVRWLARCIAQGPRRANLLAMRDYWTRLKRKEIDHPWDARTDQLARSMLRELGPSAPTDGVGDGEPTRISVFIQTLNEAANIADVVANAKQIGDVFVLDSVSKDGTQQLAREAGATVVEQPFLGYSRQKNWGLENLPFTGEWIFILDADERITPALRDELLHVVRSQPPRGEAGFYVNRVNIFMGGPIRRGGLFPSWNLRFFRRGTCRYEDRSVHEHMLCDGEREHLKHLMVHIRHESITRYVDKHIHYADLESGEWVKRSLAARRARGSASGTTGEGSAGELFTRSLRLRQWVKRSVWPRIPGRPLVRLLYMYIVRLGFFDGRIGWRMAKLMANYEYMITVFYREKMRTAKRQG